jgi:hypothetical protein
LQFANPLIFPDDWAVPTAVDLSAHSDVSGSKTKAAQDVVMMHSANSFNKMDHRRTMEAIIVDDKYAQIICFLQIRLLTLNFFTNRS